MATKNQKLKIKNSSPAKATADRQKEFSSKLTKEPLTMEELLSQVGGIAISVKRGDTVSGKVISVSPNEILVDIGKKSFGVIAEWELEQVKDFAATLKVGDKVVAQVTNPENDMGYTVLSVRQASSQKRWDVLTEKKEKGEDIEVMGLDATKGGLLVDWQGLRGFVPSTQFDSSYASNPAVLIGKSIKVKILEVDKGMNRLVLSQKAQALGMTPKVLKDALAKIKPEDVLKGTISGVAPFGIFVDIDGIEGLVHISEIAWEKVASPSSMYKVGETVEVMVLEVNEKEGKLNLSIKRLLPDPWKNILDRYPPDTNVSGKVTRVVSYGVFVQLEPGIEGLIHISKLTQDDVPKEGDEISCVIESIDEVKRKISLTFIPKEKPVGYR